MKSVLNRKGITMSEYIVTVSVIAVLLLICIPTIFDVLEKSRDNMDATSIKHAYIELNEALESNIEEPNIGLSTDCWSVSVEDESGAASFIFSGLGKKKGWDFNIIEGSNIIIDGIEVANTPLAKRIGFTIENRKVVKIEMMESNQ